MLTKIVDFIKSTGFVLGYLFSLATAYYLSYWSYFDIDVFQFISVEDIIKGIAYPLRFADVGIIGVFLFFVVIYTIISIIKFNKIERTVPLVILAFLLLPTSLILYYFKYQNAEALVGLGLAILLTFFLIVIYQIADAAYEKDKANAATARQVFADDHPSIDFRNSMISFALIFFPINAIIAGQVNARDIFDGKKYNYILRQDFPSDKVDVRYDLLIFLGAISEKYIFINANENELFIIDKEELPVLKIHHFDANNKETVNHRAEKLFMQSPNTAQPKDTTKKK
jgi:hypothetical protein